MKSLFQNILIAGLAILILTFGTGFTTVNYWCNECPQKSAFLKENEVETSCCSAEEKEADVEHRKDDHSCACKHEGKCFETKRITVDMLSETSKVQVDYSVTWISILFTSATNLISQKLPTGNNFYKLRQKMAFSPPRDYLSFIRILII